MITLVLTFRDREISIIEKCLASLFLQSNKEFKIVLVNYGSTKEYSDPLESFLENKEIEYIKCDVSKQLWNKSKAINIVLKNCTTPYLFVADIDMIFHQGFIHKLHEIKNENKATYFQVGFLDQEETNKNINFPEYKISFNSNEEATGMTLYPVSLLKEINGYDEFYHGWGSEDTDVHIRLKNSGKEIEYYDKEILILHQWHPKFYRSPNSTAPFHSSLEKINSKYLQQAEMLKKSKANLNNDWGILPKDLNDVSVVKIALSNSSAEILAFFKGNLKEIKNQTIELTISSHPEYKKPKQILKKTIGKKTISFLSFQEINDLLLLEIISNYRNSAYEYEWNRSENFINLKITLDN